ncbi:MAG: hypothetical protein ACLQPD_26850, partial [Desulfomonilaceae bacterium]
YPAMNHRAIFRGSYGTIPAFKLALMLPWGAQLMIGHSETEQWILKVRTLEAPLVLPPSRSWISGSGTSSPNTALHIR